MLIGREKEIVKFDRLLKSKQAEFLTVYGRRRIGKTFLLREYFGTQIKLEFSGTFEAPLKTQLLYFYNELIIKNIDTSNITKPKTWSEAFELLNQVLKTIKKSNEKLVVFIDELPWLDTPKSGFYSALEYFWNRHGSQMNNLLLIVCGSSATWMIRKIINAKGGLYNRTTERIELKPFTLRETELYCKAKNIQYTRYQILELYMAFGGIPFYLNMVQNGQSVQQNIDAICFQTGGLLSNEFNLLYHSLFKNAAQHMAVIEKLVEHPYGLTRNKLIEGIGFSDGGTFTRVIENLIDSGFVVKISPFGKKTKDSLYRVLDLYSIFYLKFIKGNVSDRYNVWLSIYDSNTYKAWSGYAFENVCYLHLTQIHQALNIGGMHTSVSSWSYKGDGEIPGAQIDLLIDRKDGIVQICEAKFYNTEFNITKEYSAKLRQKRGTFKEVTKTKKSVLTTLLSVYPANRNMYYNEEIYAEITADQLFNS